MKAMVKLGIGALLTGVGLVVTFSAERQLIAERECVDCGDEVEETPITEDVEPWEETDVPSFVEEQGND